MFWQPLLRLATEVQELPEVGEIVVGTVTKRIDHGAYLTLDEYNNIQAFLHISEIATGWIRHLERYVKVGEKKVAIVKRVNTARSEIDLSLKQVSHDQKKKKLAEIKKAEKGKALLTNLRESSKLTEKDVEKVEEQLLSKFDTVYDAFSEMATKGMSVVEDLKIPKKALPVIEEISSKITVPYVEIRGVMEISCKKPNGVEIIKNAILDAIGKKDSDVRVSYVGAPKYRINVTAEEFKMAEKKLQSIVSSIESTVKKNAGTFKLIREESKKTRE